MRDWKINYSILPTLLHELREVGYNWWVKTPHQLKILRKESNFSPLQNFFGLGLEVNPHILIEQGLTPDTLLNFLGNLNWQKSPISISSNLDGSLIVHDHWPPISEQASEYIHLGPESFYLGQKIFNSNLTGKNVLDLGCSQGVLSFLAKSKGARVWGLDLSTRAIATAQTLSAGEIDFRVEKIGTKQTTTYLQSLPKMDLIVFNPPLAIESGEDAYPHRDGGKLGLEIPLLFLQACNSLLAGGGQVWCLIANPKVGGVFQFEKQVNSTTFKILETHRVQGHFNLQAAHKHGYKNQRISDIDLQVITLVKK